MSPFFAEKWLWTVLHQLCEWKAPADFHRAYPESWAGNARHHTFAFITLLPLPTPRSACAVPPVSQKASATLISLPLVCDFLCLLLPGRVRAGRHSMDSYWVLQQQDCVWPHWEQGTWYSTHLPVYAISSKHLTLIQQLRPSHAKTNLSKSAVPKQERVESTVYEM